jgi:hypothetical protein
MIFSGLFSILLWLDLTMPITGIELGRFRTVFFILQWQKEEEGRYKKEEFYAQFYLQEY